MTVGKLFKNANFWRLQDMFLCFCLDANDGGLVIEEGGIMMLR